MAITKRFVDEREGQMAFFDAMAIKADDVLVDNTDGVFNGNLLEFKLSVIDLNRTLLQCIKYLSRLRVKGESVPARIVVVSLNDQTAYLYTSEDYRPFIERVYVGAA